MSQIFPLDEVIVDTIGASGHVFSVGGRVRDELRNIIHGTAAGGVDRVDADYLITGVPYDELVQKLSPLGSVELVGASFGVIKFTRDGQTVDIALPRRERSTGTHHRDFTIESAPDIPLEDDLSRRDFRINMMARDLATGALIDPFGGEQDLRDARLDILKDEVFAEDPAADLAWRAVRGAFRP